MDGPNGKILSVSARSLSPTKEEMSALGFTEKAGFYLARKMNFGRWKTFWTWCQRHIGSLWIHLATYNLMNVFGIENLEKATIEKPLLLVANHRSFFDMYTVSAMIFRRTSRPVKLFFPVRGRFFYDNPLGWLVNLVMGWWSMYPPFFREEGDSVSRRFDKFSLRELINIASSGYGTIIGFHPEGKRNLDGETYTFLPAQPGVGKLILAARPQVLPVFIAGLGNNLPKQILGNWFGGEKIRLWFGEPLDLSEFYSKRDALRTHKEIADRLIHEIAALAEKDREWMAGQKAERNSVQ
jgi:1-acyl-sn-glycerol-3-phosphate acyltransferase